MRAESLRPLIGGVLIIEGEDGADYIVAGEGEDTIDGGDGDDVLVSGPNDKASDEVTCGGGTDVAFLSGNDHTTNSRECEDIITFKSFEQVRQAHPDAVGEAGDPSDRAPESGDPADAE